MHQHVYMYGVYYIHNAYAYHIVTTHDTWNLNIYIYTYIHTSSILLVVRGIAGDMFDNASRSIESESIVPLKFP